MMNEPQKLDYQINRTNNPAIVVYFVDYSMPINLCLQKVGVTVHSASIIQVVKLYYSDVFNIDSTSYFRSSKRRLQRSESILRMLTIAANVGKFYEGFWLRP